MALSPNTISKMQRFLSGSRSETPDPQDTGILGTTKPTDTGILSSGTQTNTYGPNGAFGGQTTTPNNTTTQTNTYGPNGAFGGQKVTPPPAVTTTPAITNLDGPSANTAPGYTSTGILAAADTTPGTNTTTNTNTNTNSNTAADTTKNTGINTKLGTPNDVNTQLNADQLTKREIDERELVSSQMMNARNTPFAEDEAVRAQRFANGRGLMNSTMAASAGEEAAVRASLEVAKADADAYGKVKDYNTALNNQAYMYNVDAENNFKKLGLQIGADKDMQAVAVAAQLKAAGISAAASMHSASTNLEAARISAETSQLNAKLNALTSTGNQDSQNRTSIYNQKLSLANNIIQNPDFSPDYRRQLINGLGKEFEFLASNVFIDMEKDLNGE